MAAAMALVLAPLCCSSAWHLSRRSGGQPPLEPSLSKAIASIPLSLSLSLYLLCMREPREVRAAAAAVATAVVAAAAHPV